MALEAVQKKTERKHAKRVQEMEREKAAAAAAGEDGGNDEGPGVEANITPRKRRASSLDPGSPLLMAAAQGVLGREESLALIDMDIPRTFPDLAFFTPGGGLDEELRKVLEAYVVSLERSEREPTVIVSTRGTNRIIVRTRPSLRSSPRALGSAIVQTWAMSKACHFLAHSYYSMPTTLRPRSSASVHCLDDTCTWTFSGLTLLGCAPTLHVTKSCSNIASLPFSGFFGSTV